MPRVGFLSAVALFLLLLALPLGVAGAGVPKGGWGSPSIPVSGVIIPGFASSRLRAWALLDCPYSPLDFRPLDPVWLDTKKVLTPPPLHCPQFHSVAAIPFVTRPFQTDHRRFRSSLGLPFLGLCISGPEHGNFIFVAVSPPHISMFCS